MGISSFFVSFLEVLLIRSSRGTRSGRPRNLLDQLVSVHFLRGEKWTPKSSFWPQLQLPLGLCVGLLESQRPFPVIYSAVTFWARLGPPADSNTVLSLKQIIFPQMD